MHQVQGSKLGQGWAHVVWMLMQRYLTRIPMTQSFSIVAITERGNVDPTDESTDFLHQ
jgi:hypothetical protein